MEVTGLKPQKARELRCERVAKGLSTKEGPQGRSLGVEQN